MATEYLQKLSRLVSELDLNSNVDVALEARHFFNGAALYADQVMCASWSPAGLAFKLPELEVNKLIASGKAKPLQYFEKGHVKKGYAAFHFPGDEKNIRWKNYFLTAINHCHA